MSEKEAVFKDLNSFITENFSRDDFALIKHGAAGDDEKLFLSMRDYCNYLVDQYAQERVIKKDTFVNSVIKNRRNLKYCHFAGCNKTLSINRAKKGWIFCTQHITYTSYLDFTSYDSIMMDFNDFVERAKYFKEPEAIDDLQERKAEIERRIPNCEYLKGDLLPVCVNKPRRYAETLSPVSQLLLPLSQTPSQSPSRQQPNQQQHQQPILTTTTTTTRMVQEEIEEIQEEEVQVDVYKYNF